MNKVNKILNFSKKYQQTGVPLRTFLKTISYLFENFINKIYFFIKKTIVQYALW